MTRKALAIHPSSFAREYRLANSDVPADEVGDAVVEVLQEICRELQNRGCRLIGHVKALLHAPLGGSRFFSLTSFYERVRCKGYIDNGARDLKLIVNVIVFGVDENELRIVCEEVIGKTKIHAHMARG